MKKLAIVAGLAALALATALPALAGYRVKEVDPEFPKEITTTVFQGGKARVDGALEGLAIIIDVKAGEGWLVDEAGKRYAGGSIAALAEELRKTEEPEEDVSAADDGSADETDAAPEKPLKVEVKEMGVGEKLLGYETRRAQVLVDGELLEELWIAPKLEIAREVDPGAFGAAMQKMLGGGASANQGYEDSEAYRKLRATGYALRQVLYFVGEKTTLEVSEVAAETIPAAAFALPQGFKKVGYTDLLLGEDR